MLQETLRNGREHLVFFPDEIEPVFQPRFKRAEDQAGGGRGINQVIERQKIAEPLPGKHGAVVGKPERPLQAQLLHSVSAPSGNVTYPALL